MQFPRADHLARTHPPHPSLWAPCITPWGVGAHGNLPDQRRLLTELELMTGERKYSHTRPFLPQVGEPARGALHLQPSLVSAP